MQRASISDKFPIGSVLPSFSLKNVDGRMLGDAYLRGAPASLVVFSCNHCPYVKGSEQMLIETVKKYSGKGLRSVAICSNDAIAYPDDSFEKMKDKAKAQSLPYPYLHDETQNVARAFDAACTPEAYLFNDKGFLVYHGAINNSPKDPSAASINHLEAALEQLFSSKKIEPTFVHPLGCSIKWR